MNEEWGPWVECDGSGGPMIDDGAAFEVRMDLKGGRDLIGPPDEVNARNWPGFFWRWKRVRTGWFKSELRRVCDDPAYAPIRCYRLRKPPSIAVQLLTSIVENPRAPVATPTERERRLPKKVSA